MPYRFACLKARRTPNDERRAPTPLRFETHRWVVKTYRQAGLATPNMATAPIPLRFKTHRWVVKPTREPDWQPPPPRSEWGHLRVVESGLVPDDGPMNTFVTSVPTEHEDSPTSPYRNHSDVFTAVRTMALMVVVAWHWTFATIRWDGRGPHAGNPLHLVPSGYVLTWFLQVMPLFFLIGGWASKGSVSRHLTKGGTSTGWIRARCFKLGAPVVPLAAVLLVTRNFASPWLAGVVLLAISPLWFLGVYLPLTTLTPVLVRAHSKSPRRSMAISFLLVVACQALRFGAHVNGLAFTLMSFLIVWGTVYQVGFFLDRMRADRSTAFLVAAFGLAGIFLGHMAGYSLSMVTVKGDAISNMGPPTLQIVFLALFQSGMITGFAGSIDRFSRRSKPAKVIAWVDARQMSIYAWHLPIWVAMLVALRTTPVAVPATATASWFALRPVWSLIPLILLIAIFSRSRAATHRDPSSGTRG